LGVGGWGVRVYQHRKTLVALHEPLYLLAGVGFRREPTQHSCLLRERGGRAVYQGLEGGAVYQRWDAEAVSLPEVGIYDPPKTLGIGLR